MALHAIRITLYVILVSFLLRSLLGHHADFLALVLVLSGSVWVMCCKASLHHTLTTLRPVSCTKPSDAQIYLPFA